MPTGLIYLNALICERFLVERDDVLSAIRIVDVFYKPPPPELESIPEDKQALVVNLIVIAKFSPGSELEHTFNVSLLRPSGEHSQPDSKPHKVKINPSIVPDAPIGFNAMIQMPIFMREMGTHYLIVEVDEAEVIRVPFTVAERQNEAAGPGR